MKVLMCPKCKKHVIAEPCSSTAVLKCAFCGYTDYAYWFNCYGLHRNTRAKLDIKQIIGIISKTIDEVHGKTVDINALIYGISEKCEMLSPLVVSEIINTLLCQSENDNEAFTNDTLFVEYESEKISLSDIDVRNARVEQDIIGTIRKIEADDTDIESLRIENAKLSKKYSELEKNYLNCWRSLQEKDCMINTLLNRLNN